MATARKAVVLNVDDPLCVLLAGRAPRRTEVIYFGFDAAHPTMAGHLVRGGRAVYVDNGMLMWADGDHHLPLSSIDELPSTLNGRARHNVANAMATFAALLALAVPRARIAAGLASFSMTESQTPLRLNLYRTCGVTLMVDYAHNAAAYEEIIATGRQLTQGRLLGVVSAPCDRRAADLTAIGQICGAGFDGLVVYEMDDLRGKPAGVTAEMITQGALAEQQTQTAVTSRRRWVHTVLDMQAAIRNAFGEASPGDLIIIGCASHQSVVREALGSAELSVVDAATLNGSVDNRSVPASRTHARSQRQDYVNA